MKGRLLKVITGQQQVDDVAELTEQIEAEKRKAAEACAEIERIEAEQRTAESYDKARELDEAIARARWQVEHADAVLPELEAKLKAAQADQLAAAIAHHQAVLRKRYPQFRAALQAAVEQQANVIREREAAMAELGEHVAARLPLITYAGFLYEEFFRLWSAEQDRVFADPPPRPAVAAPRPAPAAPAAPADFGWGWSRRRVPTAPPDDLPPRPKPRERRRDPAPTASERQVQVLRPGVELPDGTQALAGDIVTLPADVAERLCRSGAAEFFTGETK